MKTRLLRSIAVVLLFSNPVFADEDLPDWDPHIAETAKLLVAEQWGVGKVLNPRVACYKIETLRELAMLHAGKPNPRRPWVTYENHLGVVLKTGGCTILHPNERFSVERTGTPTFDNGDWLPVSCVRRGAELGCVWALSVYVVKADQ